MLKKQWIALKTIVRVETTRFLRVWMQSLMPPVITAVLYFLVFGHFIGSRLQMPNNVSYMQFIVPGLVMMVMIMNAYSNATFAFFMLRFQRSVEEILVSPTDEHVILSGFCIASIVRGLLTGVIVSVVSFFFTHDMPKHLGVLLIGAILAALLFSLFGFTNAIFAKKFDDISTIPTFVLTPLIYLGGVFYSISQLPHAWQVICYFNPIFYIVSIFRYGFLGITSTPVSYSLVTLILLIGIMYSLNLYLLRKGVGIRT